MEAKDRIIVALDVNNIGDATGIVRVLAPHVGGFKLGLELCTAVGAPAAVAAVARNGGKVFLDLKFHDIPNTVGGAARAAAHLAITWFDVHASAGPAAIRAAVAKRGNAKVLGITVLTSIDEVGCRTIFGGTVPEKVRVFATMLAEAGADGVVCSPQEAEIIRGDPATTKLTIVTPGIRPAWAATGDQKRVTTPAQAIRAGADYLVIGRPITEPPPGIGTMVEAAQCITEEIASVAPRGVS